VSVHGPSWLHSETPQLQNFGVDTDPDPAFDFNVDPQPAFDLNAYLYPDFLPNAGPNPACLNDADPCGTDPDPQH
jgi:hypothetical protein